MDEASLKKAQDLIGESKRILLIASDSPTDDAVGSLLALGLFFEKKHKEIDLVCSSPVASRLSFLPKHTDIVSQIDTGNQFVISLDTSDSRVSQFSYDFDNDGNKLNIYITPDDGLFEDKHVTTQKSGTTYDLIVVVGCVDLEHIGELYAQHARLFFETPIINIDHSVSNEQFGEVNIVDVKAVATSELVFRFIEKLDSELIDQKIASALLVGIVSETQSFQSERTTPHALDIASQLVRKGANQQEIVQRIFKNKTLHTMRLWGRILSQVHHDEERRVVHVRVGKDDFEATSTTVEDAFGIEQELLSHVVDVRFVVLFISGLDEGMQASVVCVRSGDVHVLSKKMPGEVLQNSIRVKKDPQISFEQFKEYVFSNIDQLTGAKAQ